MPGRSATPTRLYLGIIDGSYFVGPPDYYGNNRGSFGVHFERLLDAAAWGLA